MVKASNKTIGLVGGTFDPAHKGHIAITKIAIKKLKLSKVFWIVTKKNPFKDNPYYSISQRLKKAKELTKGIKKIQVIHLDKRVNSSRSINIINYLVNRKIVDNLLSKMSDYIDVIVPRGGKGLVDKVQKFSNVHVIGHLEGLCHIFVDKTANLNMARKIIINAKMRRTSICGAVETLLIDEKAVNSHAKEIINSLVNSGCE